MKRMLSFLLMLCFLVPPLFVSAQDETAFTVEVPGGTPIRYTGDEETDAFAVAVGYSLAEDCAGLAGYVVTVRWDPTVLALRTDYNENMTNAEMMFCKGCYFEDLYQDGLQFAPSGTCVVNYRNVKNGELTVASISASDKPYREAILFVLDFVPLRENATTALTVSVGDDAGMTSAAGIIEDFRKKTSFTVIVGAGALFGDADGNNKVDTDDLATIKMHATGKRRLSGDAFHLADINDDGEIDGRDYLMVCQVLRK